MAFALCAGCAGLRGGSGSAASAPGDASPSPVPFANSPQPQVSFGPGGALLAPQPGSAYRLILGPATIDDGVGNATADTGAAAQNAGSAVTDLFSTGPAPSAAGGGPPTVVAARALDAQIPVSEYDLGEFAKSAPSDAVALYHIVADQVTVDGYDGVMRGPLVTFLSRAGGPTDKLVLLAYLLLSKGIPYQFVRGTLTDDERTRIVRSAASATAPPAGDDPQAQAYAGARVTDGSAFAAWATGVLAGKSVALGSSIKPGEQLAARHYWIQIDRGGKLLDLDPTIPGTAEGEHLGTLDPAFKPWAALPGEEWHQLQIRVLAERAGGTRTTLLEHTDTVANVAYSPIRVLFAPAGTGADPLNPGAANAFDGGIKIGSEPGSRAHVELGSGRNAVRALTLEIRRKDASGKVIEVAQRALLDPALPAPERAARLAGMTTILVAPGRGATAFTLHEQMHALTLLAQDMANAKAGKKPSAHGWYPLRIADFFGRADAIRDSLSAGEGGRLYRDRPSVVMLRTWFAPGPNGTAAAVNIFDIAEDGMASASGQSTAAVRANLTRGYADTQIERDVLEGGAPRNTIAVFTAAGAQNIATTVLTQPAASDSGDPLRAGLAATLAAGEVAIAPAGAVTVGGRPAFGWWAVDPASGNSVGRTSGGFGQDMAEYSVTINTVSRAYTLYGQLQAGATCIQSGAMSVGCAVAVCSSIASYIFGGGTVAALASNYAAGKIADAGCGSAFGGGGK